MRKFAIPGAIALLAIGVLVFGQEGPNKDVGDTVARPRKKTDTLNRSSKKILQADA